MDSQDIPNDPKKQASPSDSPGQTRRPGRPRKHAPAAAAPGNGFDLPARPEVAEQAKTDPRKFAVIPIRAIRDKAITPTAFRVLALVASYANRNGFTWVSQETLAADMGITPQAISLHIVALKAAGLIEETAKAYWGGPTARCSTMRVIFDPTLTADDVIARAGSAEQEAEVLAPNIQKGHGAITSSNGKVVDRSRVELESTAAALIGEVLERYRGEGLTPPTGHALEREAAMLASMRARQGLSL
jgi:hypothetical protein